MMYTLVIGIEYKKYKKPANISISANNKFIDTFDLDRDYPATSIKSSMIEGKWYESLGKTHWLHDQLVKKDWCAKFFKVYLVPEEHLYDNLLRKGIIEIKVVNSNSDFTNGFMKNSSLIKLSQLSLFPSYMSANQGEKLMKTSVKFNNALWKRHHIKPVENPEERHTWPCVRKFRIDRENEVYEKDSIKDIDTWIGGSFTAKVYVKKKFKMIFLNSKDEETKGFWHCGEHKVLSACSLKPLLNIYHEDQRNSN